MRPTSAHRATQVLGGRVWGLGNVALGTICDMVINARTGRVRYVIVVPALGDGLVPIPWGMLLPGPVRGDYLVPWSRDRLRDAPIYPPQALPDFDDPRAIAELHAFFGCPPD